MTKLYKIKFLKKYGEYKIGDIVNTSKRSAETMINAGYGEYVEENEIDESKLREESSEFRKEKMIEIPEQLQREEFRFILLGKAKKEPLEKEWQTKNNYAFDDPKLLSHLEADKNYGVALGFGNLIVIDGDTKEITKIASDGLPITFAVKTSKGMHYYYKIDKKIKPIRLSKEKQGDLGDVRSVGQYVVGANCTHPTGALYKVWNDLPITEISEEAIRSAFLKYIDKSDATEFKEFPITTTKRSSKYVRECQVPDYLLNNKLKPNMEKNAKLFRFVVDILHNREVNEKVFATLAKKQGHPLGAIQGWVKMAREGKLGKSSCELMREYLLRFAPELIGEICGGCDLYKRKRIVIEAKTSHSEVVADSTLDREKLKLEFIDFTYNSKGEITRAKVNVSKFTKYLLSKYNFKTIYETISEKIFVYQKGIYVKKGRKIIQTEAESILKEYCSNHYVVEITEKIKRLTAIDKEEFDYIPEEMICLENGVFNLQTQEFLKHDPKYYFKTKLPIKYDKKADCPNIKRFFETALYPDDIPVMQEWFGYCLYKNYFIKKALICFGKKDTGKTVMMKLLTTFLGDKNISGLSLQRISSGDKFRLVALENKFANLFDDLTSQDMVSGGFKVATGGGYITAEHKFGDQFQFKPYSKLTFAGNKIPSVKEIDADDDAYYDRWMPIAFDNVIEKEKQDKFFIQKLTTEQELSGLLNFALEGLKKILERDMPKFSFDKDWEEIKRIMERNSIDPLPSFCQDVLIEKGGNKISKEDMFKIYNFYAEKENKPKLSIAQIGRRLPKYAKYILPKRANIRFWENVGINELKVSQDTLDTLFLLIAKKGNKKDNINDNVLNNIHVLEKSVVSVVKNKGDKLKTNEEKVSKVSEQPQLTKEEDTKAMMEQINQKAKLASEAKKEAQIKADLEKINKEMEEKK